MMQFEKFILLLIKYFIEKLDKETNLRIYCCANRKMILLKISNFSVKHLKNSELKLDNKSKLE